VRTSRGFDEWQANKRQRPAGTCSACRQVKELRQREPEALCGACWAKLDRRAKKEADPLAVQRDAKKCEKKIRSEMNKLLNIADAVDGLIAIEDQKQLERVAKLYLQPIIGDPGDHGHGGFGHDRDQDDATTIGDGSSTDSAVDAKPADGAFAPGPPARNIWWSMTPDQKKQAAAEGFRAWLAKKRAEAEGEQRPQSDPVDDGHTLPT
jgi:hypothetical protein